MSTDTKYKFKKGDRVRVTSAPLYVPEMLGQTGTIDEDESTVPFVITDEGERLAMWAHKMELITAKPEQPAATDLDQQPTESPATFEPSAHTMNPIITILAANIASIICTIAAFTLAINGVESWGWFLAAAAWCATRVDCRR